MKQPHEYPKRTLFAVIGMTPQIVTESLYVLTEKQQPAFVPTDIKIITTSRGADQVRLNLLSESPGWFDRFCRDYGHTDIQFSENDIQVLTRPDGKILDDIREPEDNELMADAITETIRKLTRDEDRAVHVSIAGGRKTMGYYAGYALSLFGREQDRLSHVLVEAPYESLHDFYYTTPYRKVIPAKDKLSVDTAKGKITLAEIPFISLRQGLPDRLLEGMTTLSDTVQIAKKVLGSTKIIFDTKARRVECAEQTLNLPPRDFAFYLWMATRKKNNLPPIRWTDADIAKEYLVVYETIVGSASAQLDKVKTTLKDTKQAKNIPEDDIRYCMEQGFFEQRMTRIKKELSNELGKANIGRYFFNKVGKWSETRIELAAESVDIKII